MSLADLRLAPGRNQIRLAFVPLLDLRTNAVAGFIAHACWEHPTLGRVAPERVRPLAEATELTRELDAWTLELVGDLLAGWERPALDALALLAVVVDPRTLGEAAARRYLQATADFAGLPSRRLRMVSGHTELAAALAHLGLTTSGAGAVTAEEATALIEASGGAGRPVSRPARRPAPRPRTGSRPRPRVARARRPGAGPDRGERRA